jgi:hypothetical protein
MDCDGKFDGAEVRGKMAAVLRGRLHYFLTDIGAKLV